MPYIKKEERIDFDKVLDELPIPRDKGELEYVIFKIMRKYMSDKTERYSNLHDCTYAVMHCADEFKRRFLDKREDDAKDENGDII